MPLQRINFLNVNFFLCHLPLINLLLQVFLLKHFYYFENFVSKNSPKLVSGSENFILDSAVAFASDNTPRIERSSDCVNTTDEVGPVCKVTTGDEAWRYHLGEPDVNPESTTGNKFRKTSAAPTVYRGKVYFPIYQPPVGDGSLKCEQGNAFICATDEECGINESAKLDTPDDLPGGVPDSANNSCAYVRGGVLSELVAFSDNLFANVAGPSADASTLYRVPALPGDIISNRGGWRDSSY